MLIQEYAVGITATGSEGYSVIVRRLIENNLAMKKRLIPQISV